MNGPGSFFWIWGNDLTTVPQMVESDCLFSAFRSSCKAENRTSVVNSIS
jgi:hypothetical protein